MPLGGGGGIFLNSEFDLFFWDDLHLQIIASICREFICREFISPVGYLTHMHKQCESMEWQKCWAGRPCTELLAPTIFHTLKHWYQYTYLGL